MDTQVADLLGGERVLGASVKSNLDLARATRQRLPAETAVQLGDAIGLTAMGPLGALIRSLRPKVDRKGTGEAGTIKAIYELQGEQLKLCLGEPGKDRPSAFTTAQGAPQLLWVLDFAAHALGIRAGSGDYVHWPLHSLIFTIIIAVVCGPLIVWGWTRVQCLQFIFEVLGVWWPKSACVYCAFNTEASKATESNHILKGASSTMAGGHRWIANYRPASKTPRAETAI